VIIESSTYGVVAMEVTHAFMYLLLCPKDELINHSVKEVDKTRYPFGLGSSSNPLIPYLSVAATGLQNGLIFYVPEFDGITLPGTI
jgi:hypothetical protein